VHGEVRVPFLHFGPLRPEAVFDHQMPSVGRQK
jgi:hypothetical protein